MKRLLTLLIGVLLLFSCEMASVKPEITTSESRSIVPYSKSAVLDTSIDLGIASDYNLFILGDMEMMWTDALGRVAAAGDITLSGYGVALEEAELTDEYSLIAGGNISHTYGSVYHGNVAYGDTYTATGVSILNGEAILDTPIDFAAEEENLKVLSSYLENQEANGEIVNQWGKVVFTGSLEVNFFTISTEEIESAHTLDLDIPEGSTAVINVEGTSTSIMNKGMTEAFNLQKQNVLFNFPNQTELTIQSIGLKGSILAPYAALTFQWGNIEGNIVAASVYGSGESHLYPFIPVIVENTPEVPENLEITCITQYKLSGGRYQITFYGYGMETVNEVYVSDKSCYIYWQEEYGVSFCVYTTDIVMNESNTVEFVFENGARYIYEPGLIVEEE